MSDDLSFALERAIAAHARTLGFDAVGFCAASLDRSVERGLRAFVAENRHGTMQWMEERLEQRAHPRKLWPEARSVISLGLSYAPPERSLPFATLARPDRGNISVYARNRDYHDVMKGMLKHLAQYVVKVGGPGAQVKVFVDTAPVAERDLAVQAGLGWRGKHGCVVSRTQGSWLFLGEIFTTLDLRPLPDRETKTQGSCGSCTRCLNSCPTEAFLEDGKMDARRCISYLTIEHHGPIPLELRPLMGNRIYGCDDCVAVCPWNRFAPPGQTPKLQPRSDREAPDLVALAQLDDAGFRKYFSGSPIKRIGRNRFLRNVLVAIGNAGSNTGSNTGNREKNDAPDPARLSRLLSEAQRLRHDLDPVVAECAEWAVGRLIDASSKTE